ncbi:hypothetical protein CAPTEDRAFT_217909 [Capitella teleta]|uniref:Uncharacterized protein n=1 Tax=Capitella teleta TaxID=283909 RepID=R7VAC5_CAPTE|nr:hypothetical protein CAPTEDRAFT_217909 [Capitella teleta]|eukprot:ELU13281.1 hypothetical protein CAPTEDRAFT_217909 [Capitella teleta]
MEDEEKEALRKRFVKYINQFSTPSFSGLNELYTVDARYMPPDADKTIGREAIKEAHKNKQSRVNILRFYFDLLEVQVPVPGQFGFTSSISAAIDPYGRCPGKYKDLILWKKINGEWYIYRHMYNNRPVH